LKGITDRHTRKQQIDELLETVRLEDAANKRLKTYSGGMKRRIGIAQVLLGQPKLVIVDEPTVGLDPEERVRFRNLLSTLAARCTVILSTHIIEDISHSCQQLAVMDKGSVLFCGAPADLIAQARGHVWTLVTTGDTPDDGLSVISTMQMQQGVQYRVLGIPGGRYGATAVDPNLEDSYMWLMKHAKAEIKSPSSGAFGKIAG
jgi:ABC-2 type transport system ATP-binding protein